MGRERGARRGKFFCCLAASVNDDEWYFLQGAAAVPGAVAAEAVGAAAGLGAPGAAAGDGARPRLNNLHPLQALADSEITTPIVCNPRDVEVGPIWNNGEAQSKVEAWIGQHSEFAGWRWTGEW